MTNILLTDYHILLRKGLAALVTRFGHTVLFKADKDFIAKLNAGNLPDVVLMDINMPQMDVLKLPHG